MLHISWLPKSEAEWLVTFNLLHIHPKLLIPPSMVLFLLSAKLLGMLYPCPLKLKWLEYITMPKWQSQLGPFKMHLVIPNLPPQSKLIISHLMALSIIIFIQNILKLGICNIIGGVIVLLNLNSIFFGIQEKIMMVITAQNIIQYFTIKLCKIDMFKTISTLCFTACLILYLPT